MEPYVCTTRFREGQYSHHRFMDEAAGRLSGLPKTPVKGELRFGPLPVCLPSQALPAILNHPLSLCIANMHDCLELTL